MAFAGPSICLAVRERGWLLYKKDEGSLHCSISTNEDEVKKENEALFIQSKLKADGFLAAADLPRIRKEYNLFAPRKTGTNQEAVRDG